MSLFSGLNDFDVLHIQVNPIITPTIIPDETDLSSLGIGDFPSVAFAGDFLPGVGDFPAGALPSAVALSFSGVFHPSFGAAFASFFVVVFMDILPDPFQLLVSLLVPPAP
ncbi:16995_t:CDS:2 [Funneliformis geosporum]|nr:16995_t:CDS:2 [Funneliformis geosporum]